MSLEAGIHESARLWAERNHCSYATALKRMRAVYAEGAELNRKDRERKRQREAARARAAVAPLTPRQQIEREIHRLMPHASAAQIVATADAAERELEARKAQQAANRAELDKAFGAGTEIRPSVVHDTHSSTFSIGERGRE